MSTPQITDAVEGRHASHAAQSVQPQKAATEKTTDNTAYIEKAVAWNDLPLKAWGIAALVQSDKVYAVLKRKELQFDLLDWFEDARVGAVMRGEKIVSENQFWADLFRQSIGDIQQHFGSLPVRVVDTPPQGKTQLIFGDKPNTGNTPKPMPSPVADKQPQKQKRRPSRPRS